MSDESLTIIETVTRGQDETYDAFIGRITDGGQSAIALKLADIGDYLAPDRLSRLPAETADRLEQKYRGVQGRLSEALS